MKMLTQLVSGVSLFATLMLPAVYLAGAMSLEAMKGGLLAATLAWFLATPLWMDRANSGS